MLQTLIVAMIVAAATLYSAWALLPAAARRQAAARLAQRAGHWGLGDLRARELERTLASSGGCSDCSSCKGCATPGPTAQAGGSARVVIPITVSRRSTR